MNLVAPTTPRQRDVLKLIAEGCTDRQIAEALGVSVTTVHRHVRNIFLNLGATNRTHAVVLGVRHGILTIEAEAVRVHRPH